MFGPKHDPYCCFACAEPAIDRPLGCILLGRSSIPGVPASDRSAYVQPCTATTAEINERVAGGEFGFDVYDEHCSTIWFVDRWTWRRAWRIARLITKGRKVEGFESGDVYVWPGICMAIQLSAHHIALSQEVA